MNNSNWQENLRGKILASFYLYQGEVRPPKWFLKVIEDTLGHTSSLLEEERQGLVKEVEKLRQAPVTKDIPPNHYAYNQALNDAYNKALDDILSLLTKKE